MKITMEDVKRMIIQEVQEALSPLDFSQGRDPAVSGTPDLFSSTAAPEQKNENPTHISIDDLVATLNKIRPDGGAIMMMLLKTLSGMPREERSAELNSLAGALALALGDYKKDQ